MKESTRSGSENSAAPIDQELWEIWSMLFPGERVDRESDFFALGGHSLLAIRLVVEIQERFGVALSLDDVVAHGRLDRLARLVARRTANGSKAALQPIPRVDRSGPLPLSPTQEFLLFETILHGKLPVYNEVATIHLGASVDPARLQKAFNRLLDRHEAFRTGYNWESGDLRQAVQGSAECELQVVDFRAHPPGERETVAGRYAGEWAAQPFNLGRPPLIRGFIGLHSEEDHRLYVVAHHLATDAFTLFDVVPRDLWHLYSETNAAGASALPELPVQYPDIAAWWKRDLATLEISGHLEYWKSKLDGAEPFQLPPDIASDGRDHAAGARKVFHLSHALSRHIKLLAQECGCTTFVVLLAAFKVLMFRLTAVDDIMLGSVSGGREHPQVQRVAGCFLWFLALRTRINPETSFKALAADVRETVIGALQHQELPLSRVMQVLKSAADGRRQSLYRVMFLVEPPIDPHPGGWSVNRLEFYPGYSKLDLIFELDENEGAFFGRVEYRKNRYSSAYVDDVISRYRGLLELVVSAPDTALTALLRDSVQHGREGAERDSIPDYTEDPEMRLYDPMEKIAAATPDNVAVEYGATVMTYGELKGFSDCIARRLQSEGVTTGEVVAVIARRSLWLPAALFGVIKTGAAYLPIDPDLPPERFRYLLEDSRARVALVDDDVEVPQNTGIKRIGAVDASRYGGGQELVDCAKPEDLAYVLYTSGSTGKPKGAMIEHRSIVNRLQWMAREYLFTAKDVQIQKTPITFDVSLHELFLWSFTGARLVVPPPRAEKDPAALIRIVQSHRVTQMHFVPSMLEVFLAYLSAFGNARSLFTLRHVHCSGEALPPATVQSFQKLIGQPLGVGLHNLYGPTEAAVDVSYYDCSEFGAGRSVPIGKPVWNTELHVLDDQLQPVPPGEPGELYIGGIQVGRGYINQPELTTKAFIPDPFKKDPHARLYKTGDQARRMEDGNLEYLGRNDFQVKIRGIRIELGEIEEAIRKVPGVTASVVVLNGKGSDNPQLVAYYCSNGPVTVAARTIKSSLRSGLPPIMVPDLYVKLDTLPLTSSGKVDRRSLPEPELSVDSDSPVEDAAFEPDSLEGRIAEVWKGVVHTSGSVSKGGFFEQGGNSLLAVQLVARLRQKLGISVELGEFLRNPVFLTAVEIARREAASPGTANGPKHRSGGNRLPLSWGQRRLWFLHQLDIDKTAHNIVLAVKIKGQLDYTALQEATRVLMKRHEALRTVFEVSRDEPEQVILPVEKIPEAPVAISEIHEPGHSGHVLERIQDGYRHPFDLETGPLFAPRVFSFKDGQHLMRIVLHHIIADDPSAAIVLNELCAAYNAILEGKSPLCVAEYPLQAGDAALWERSADRMAEAKKQLGWWQKQLEGAPSVLRLPTDFRRPAETSFLGARTTVPLPPDTSRAFRDILRDADATPFMGFLAAWSAFLGRISRQHDLVVGAPVSLRTFPGLDSTVGFLLNTLPFRIGWKGEECFQELLNKVRRSALDAYRHRDLPFEQLVDSLKTERYAGIPPVFQVMLVMLGQADSPPEIKGCRTELHTGESDASKFDLTLFVGEEDGSFKLTLEYRRDLFLPETIAAWLDGFVAMLGEICERPKAPVDNIRAVAEKDHDCQLDRSSGGVLSADRYRTLPEWILAAIKSGPSAIAVEDTNGTLAYGELETSSAAWASRIRRCIRSRNAPVGVLLPKSREWVTALVAVMRAGAVYVPLDPAWPDERLCWVIEDAGLELVLVEPGEGETRIKNLLEGNNALESVIVEPFNAVEAPGGECGQAVGDGPGPEDLAYMIYTSGSTGLPKGVEVEHRNLLASTLARSSVYGGFPSRFLLLSPAVFDSSIAGLFWTLCNGGTLVLPEGGSERDPEVLVKQIQESGISHYLTFPSMHQLLLSRLDGHLSALDTVIVAGEACPPQLPARHRDRLEGVRLFNEYGPTEGSVWCSAENITDFEDDGRPVPIGKPVPGYRLFVLDNTQKFLPSGAIGEIVIGGAGVVRGYHNRPEQTQECFLEAPSGLKAAGRLYRTGDLGRWRPDGSMDFLGRLDAQVKLRGHRIELGEVEAGLKALDGVGDAVALVREFHEGDYRLLAFVEPIDEKTLDPARLKGQLALRLPAYALPSMILVERELPRTATGKADRKALERKELDSLEGSEGLAGDHLTAALLSIWRNLLGIASITPDDDFFASGGDSFLAVRLFSEIERSLGIRLSIATLYRAPTIRSLAGIIRESTGEQDPNLPMVVPIRPGGSDPPLFFIHPRDGGILVYRELAQHLSDQRMVYGVEAPWRHSDIVGDETIEAIAGHYLPGILKNAGKEPIHLAGFSTGGLVALELAQQLRDKGHEVGLVALFDTYNPANPPKREKAVKRWATHVKMHGQGNIIQRATGIVHLVVNTAHIKIGVAREWFNAGRAGLVRRFRKDVPIHLRHFESRKTMLTANYSYRPKPYAGPLVLFRASQAELGYVETEDLGWRMVNHPQFRIVPAQGGHTNMMAGSHGKSLAGKLDESMQSAEAKG